MLKLLAFFLLLAVATITFQESRRTEMDAPAFAKWLALSGLESRHFTTTNEDSVVSIPELYDATPETSAILQLPPEFLQAVRVYERSCAAHDLAKASEISSRYGFNPSKLLMWHQGLCQRDFKDFRVWLVRPPFIHPSGQSYAKLITTLPFASGINIEGERYLHVNERETLSEFDQWFLTLPLESRATLLRGFQVLGLEDELVFTSDWHGQSRDILIFPLDRVNEKLRSTESVSLHARASSSSCERQWFRLCLEKEAQTVFWRRRWLAPLLILGLLFLASLGVFSFYGLRQRRYQRNADQALLFQVIAHEIRTPLTLLKLSADGMRAGFDLLDEKSQRHFMGILEATQDVDKITSRTLRELQNGKSKQVLDLASATLALIENKYQDLVSYQGLESGLLVIMSDFWFDICLGNLIRNALAYGQAPVEVSLRTEKKFISVEVRDQGQASLVSLQRKNRPWLGLLRALIFPKKKDIFEPKKTAGGLGIGLKIVTRKLAEVGAELLIQEKPTRYTMRFPRRESE